MMANNLICARRHAGVHSLGCSCRCKADAALRRFAERHLSLAVFGLFAGVPVLALLAVSVLTTVIILPGALLCGWL